MQDAEILNHFRKKFVQVFFRKMLRKKRINLQIEGNITCLQINMSSLKKRLAKVANVLFITFMIFSPCEQRFAFTSSRKQLLKNLLSG